MKGSRIPELDALRFIAAIAVVFYHYCYFASAQNAKYPEIAPLAHYGYLGVQLFFIISGFAIARSAEARTPGEFLAGRFSRLWPPFAVACTFTWLFVLTLGNPPIERSFWEYLASMTMLGRAFKIELVDGVYWTLLYEWIFYFCMAAVIAWSFTKRLELSLWLWALVSAIVLYLDNQALEKITVASYSGLFISGVCFYRMHEGKAKRTTQALLVTAIVLAFFQTWNDAIYRNTHYHENFDVRIVLALMTSFFIVFYGLVQGKFTFFGVGILSQLGRLTYSLYLVHQNVGYTLSNHLEPTLGRWPMLALQFAQAFALAWLMHRFVEGPSQRWVSQKLSPLWQSGKR